MPTVAEFLKEHVALDVECFDRLYLNGYIPSLQTGGQLTYFLTRHLGNKIASPALLGRITSDFSKAVEAFIRDQGIPRVEFSRGRFAVRNGPASFADQHPETSIQHHRGATNKPSLQNLIRLLSFHPIEDG